VTVLSAQVFSHLDREPARAARKPAPQADSKSAGI
jgi:hypothetical protein